MRLLYFLVILDDFIGTSKSIREFLMFSITMNSTIMYNRRQIIGLFSFQQIKMSYNVRKRTYTNHQICISRFNFFLIWKIS